MILLDPAAQPVIAHRGASGEYPENTLLAFDRALAEGADALELDVRVTADGVPVVIHDPTVDRTTNGTGLVAEFELGALRELDAGRGEWVPALAEVLERFPGTPLIVEIKDPSAAHRVAKLVIERGAIGRVVVGAFEHSVLRPFLVPPFIRSASRRETAVFWAVSHLGWAVRGARYQVFCVPEYRGRLRVIDPAFVKAARRRGKPVHVWTINDLGDAARLRTVGVAGIITDFPARMRMA